MARARLAAEGARQGAFAPVDWVLTAAVSLTMGSSFLLIAVAVEDLAPPLVALLRLLLGAGALALVPAARRPLPRADRPRVGLLGLVWMPVPFVLFPLAERSVDSSLAGMVNAATPLFAALAAGVALRRAPGGAQAAGLVTGACGVALLGGGTAAGVAMLLVAGAGYGLAVNLAVPLQQRHGALGTGLAFAALTLLVSRVGATRGSAVTYLLPIVALGLGAGVLGEPVRAPAIAGVVLVLAGAVLVSRRERRRAPHGGRPAPTTGGAGSPRGIPPRGPALGR